MKSVRSAPRESIQRRFILLDCRIENQAHKRYDTVSIDLYPKNQARLQDPDIGLWTENSWNFLRMAANSSIHESIRLLLEPLLEFLNSNGVKMIADVIESLSSILTLHAELARNDEL
jgi:hypothetical protein